MRLLLVDDHKLFRQGLTHLLRDHPTLQVVGQAASGEEAIQMVRELLPEMVLMDVNMPGQNGIAALRQIRQEFPATRVVMLSMSERDEDLLEALQAGAAGYVLKSVDFEALVRSLEGAAAGQAALSRELTARLLSQLSSGAPTAAPMPSADRLTEREREIMVHLARGASNKQIALALALSEHTVRSHVTNILAKLSLENRFQAAAYALQNGLA